MTFSFLIIDATEYAATLKLEVEAMGDFVNLAITTTREQGVNKILELKPHIVFVNAQSIPDALFLISELSEFLDDLPYIVMTSSDTALAFDCYQRGFTSFLQAPVAPEALRKTLMRFKKQFRQLPPKKISIKSQGDYHFLSASDILYLKADNNTTDFYLVGGKVVTAYKTLKYFENVLPDNFYRIHHSYVVNAAMISRINLTKNECYLNNFIILPYSRTYKSSIENIIEKISI